MNWPSKKMEIISADPASFCLHAVLSEIHFLLAAWRQGALKLHFSRVKMKSPLMRVSFLFSYLSHFSFDLLGVFVDGGPVGEIAHVAHGVAADGLHRFDCLINTWNKNKPKIENQLLPRATVQAECCKKRTLAVFCFFLQNICKQPAII